MILKIFGFNLEIIFTEKESAVLVVENSSLFTNIVHLLYSDNSEEESNEVVIIDQDKRLSIKKDLLVISDILSYDVNDRKFINKLYKLIETEIQINTLLFSDFLQHISQMNTLLLDDLLSIDVEFSYKNEITISSYLKLIELKVDTVSHVDVVEKFFHIIDIVVALDVAKGLVFINSLVYLSENDINEVVKYARYKRLAVLFLEGHFEKKGVDIKTYLIDQDFYDYEE